MPRPAGAKGERRRSGARGSRRGRLAPAGRAILSVSRCRSQLQVAFYRAGWAPSSTPFPLPPALSTAAAERGVGQRASGKCQVSRVKHTNTVRVRIFVERVLHERFVPHVWDGGMGHRRPRPSSSLAYVHSHRHHVCMGILSRRPVDLRWQRDPGSLWR